MWSKNTTTETYIVLGTEVTQTTRRYFYGVWKTTGYTYVPIADVPAGDNEAQLSTYYSGGRMRVVVNSANVLFDQATSATENIWWVVQIGTRIQAAADTAMVRYTNMSRNMWQCGSCGGAWYFQTNDGTMKNLQSAYEIVQAWQVPPHVSPTGGVYETLCGTSSNNCP
jgi:hypothetical protein